MIVATKHHMGVSNKNRHLKKGVYSKLDIKNSIMKIFAQNSSIMRNSNGVIKS